MEDFERILKYEFDAEPDSFLLKLRVNLEWDQTAFERLTTAMEACCVYYAQQNTFERWMAEGFWYLSHFVKDWSSHPNFPRIHGKAYYQHAYERLYELAFWFFTGTL